jgi:transcriptional regulator with XRE-family HTH domain
LTSLSERKTFQELAVIYQDKIRAAYERLNISAETLAAMAGISPASLSRFMTRNANLPELSKLMQTIADLDTLVIDANPYSLPFDDADALQKMIERYRGGLRFIPVAVGTREEIADFEVEGKQ